MAKLYFRYGAMNSGKTTALMQVAYNYKERGMRGTDPQTVHRYQRARFHRFPPGHQL